MFKQVYEHNDWGIVYYNFICGGTAYASQRHESLSEGKFVTVKFKDGSTAKKKIVGKHLTNTVHDHGHRYDVNTKRLGVNEKVRGNKIFIPLSELKVECND